MNPSTLKRLARMLIVCGVALLALSPRASSAKNSENDEALIEDLDACVQQRFLAVDKGFGIRRIGGSMTAHVFIAESPQEVGVYDRIRERSLMVSIYLASISAYEAMPSRQEINLSPRRGIRGPVSVSSAAFLREPQPIEGIQMRELWPTAREALLRSGQWVHMTTQDGRTVRARGVLAANGSCVGCHANSYPITLEGPLVDRARQMEIGDPIGAVLYVSKEKPQAPEVGTHFIKPLRD